MSLLLSTAESAYLNNNEKIDDLFPPEDQDDNDDYEFKVDFVCSWIYLYASFFNLIFISCVFIDFIFSWFFFFFFLGKESACICVCTNFIFFC